MRSDWAFHPWVRKNYQSKPHLSTVYQTPGAVVEVSNRRTKVRDKCLLSRLWEVQLLTYSLQKRARWWGIMTCWGRMQQKASSTERYDYSLMYRGQEGTE